MTLNEYYDALINHDWYHPMSDDHRDWEKGNRIEDMLQGRSQLSEAHYNLFQEFLKYYRFNTRSTIPDRPSHNPV